MYIFKIQHYVILLSKLVSFYLLQPLFLFLALMHTDQNNLAGLLMMDGGLGPMPM